MNINLIKTDNDYNQALERLEVIFDAKKGTQEGDELELLGILIDQYENEKFPIDLPDPIEAIKFRMEQMGYTQKDLAKNIGFKNIIEQWINFNYKIKDYADVFRDKNLFDNHGHLNKNGAVEFSELLSNDLLKNLK